MDIEHPAAEQPRVREAEPVRGTIGLTPAAVAGLQRTVGNTAVARLLEVERRASGVARSRRSAELATRRRLLARSPDEQKVKARAYEIWQRQGERPTSQAEAEANYFEAVRQIEIEERAHRIAEERGGGDPVANYYEAERQIQKERTGGGAPVASPDIAISPGASPVPVGEASAPSLVPPSPALNLNAPSFVPKSASPTGNAPSLNVSAPSFVPKSASPTGNAPLNVSAPSFVPKSASPTGNAPSLNVSAPSFVPMWASPTGNAPGFNVSAPSFVTTHASQAPLPAIGVEEFQACHQANRLSMRAVKWWSSHNYPNHNIEIELRVDGRLWAIAHVKWKDRNGPTEQNVEMATFKAADRTSIPGGNIWSGATRDMLIAEALQHKDKAPKPGAQHVDVVL